MITRCGPPVENPCSKTLSFIWTGRDAGVDKAIFQQTLSLLAPQCVAHSANIKHLNTKQKT